MNNKISKEELKKAKRELRRAKNIQKYANGLHDCFTDKAFAGLFDHGYIGEILSGLIVITADARKHQKFFEKLLK